MLVGHVIRECEKREGNMSLLLMRVIIIIMEA